MPKSPSSPLSYLMSAGAAQDYLTHRGGVIAPREAKLVTGDEREERSAFVHITPHAIPLPVLIAVPHAGRAYPEDVIAGMRDPERSQLRLEDRYVDAVGVEVAKATGTGLLVAQAPRAMLDLNRAPDDIDWAMIDPQERERPLAAAHRGTNNGRARNGLGLVPRRLSGSGEVWRSRLPIEELERRIEQIHKPYHRFLSAELERIRDMWGAALLIDLHSMPPLRRPSGDEPAPQIVLGDRYGASCHNALAAHAFRYLDNSGCRAWHNRPYSGGYVLDRHAAPTRGIHAIQIELCRTTYLDAALREPVASMGPLAKLLAGLVRDLGGLTARLGSGGQLAQAAE